MSLARPTPKGTLGRSIPRGGHDRAASLRLHRTLPAVEGGAGRAVRQFDCGKKISLVSEFFDPKSVYWWMFEVTLEKRADLDGGGGFRTCPEKPL